MTWKRKRKNSEVHTEQVTERDGYFVLGWSTLPDDLLVMISEKIDLVRFFALGGVCKNWRKFYEDHRGDFMASPLLILRPLHARKACSFFSISEEKGYKTLLHNHSGESSTGFWDSFVGFSSGYLICQDNLSFTKLWLINPFTRKELHIPESPYQGLCRYGNLMRFDHAILAFVVNSEDFVVLGIDLHLCSLFLYQSRESSWRPYKRDYYHTRVADVAVFRRTVYAVTCRCCIGILSLNSPDLKLLKLKNVPTTKFSEPKLVSSNGELLVVDVTLTLHLYIYRIDFSNMEWVKVHSLGDRALFVGKYMQSYALSNPRKRGYESNCVYYIDPSCPMYRVYSFNNATSVGMVSAPVETVCDNFGTAATSRHRRRYPMA